MNKLIMMIAGLLFASSVMATNVTLREDTTVSSDEYSSRAEALTAGRKIVSDLKSMTQNELANLLLTFINRPVTDIRIETTKLKIEEHIVGDGTKYRAIVDLDFQFKTSYVD